MGVPKRRHSRSRRDKKTSHQHLLPPPRSRCPRCGTIKLPHRVCPNCGYYKDRQIFEIEE